MDKNPFRPPKQLSPAAEGSSLVYVFACLVWCGLAIKMAVVRPIVRSMLEEFDVALPTLTVVLVHPLQTWLFIAIAVAMLMAGVVTNTAAARRKVGRLGLVAAVIALAAIAIGFGLPLLQLMQELSGP